ncbi:hypothetical protein Tco_1138549 [Tanacetum coccineum]
MEEDDCLHVVEEAWNKDVRSIRLDYRFRDRLKNFKVSLRTWSKERFGRNREKIEKFKKDSMRWELEVEKKNIKQYGKRDRLRNFDGGRRTCLEKTFIEAEEWDAIQGIWGDKAPCPDGF